MNALEDGATATAPTAVPKATADETLGAIAPLPRLAPMPHKSPAGARRDSRFAVYFTNRGWVHALLLLSVWLFLFPFLWMFGTSLKTDEELMDSALLPALETFRPTSPYVRPAVEPKKPTDVSISQWDDMLPKLTDMASAAIARYQSARPPEPAITLIDPEQHRRSAAARLVNGAVGKIDRRLWAGAESALLAEYQSQLTPTAIQSALSDSLARLELSSFQLRTLDLHNYVLTDGDFTPAWRVESGNAKLVATGDATRVAYHFDSSSAEPLVLRYDFHLPAGTTVDDLHKLTIAILPDNSWHRVSATLDVAGQRWGSTESSYIAQHRPTAFVFQPPTFEDQLLRAKTWISLAKTGASPINPTGVAASAANTATSSADVPATFRLIIAPSSTFRANLGKAWRNYDRAFKSVPFWKYMTNSLLLVVLCTSGSLFSASFVAYAFARLHWPGRSAAFLLVLATMMLPGQVTMIPGFMIWRALHWYNTLNPLWVPAFFGSAFFIFLMTQHMRTIPKDLEEAARIDGLNALQSWYYVILPNVTPTLAAIAILSFMGAWNEFMGPLIYLRDQTRFPLSLGLYGLGLLRTTAGSDYGWSVVMAGNMLMTVPVILVFFLFQRYFVQGMTLTGMKG